MKPLVYLNATRAPRGKRANAPRAAEHEPTAPAVDGGRPPGVTPTLLYLIRKRPDEEASLTLSDIRPSSFS